MLRVFAISSGAVGVYQIIHSLAPHKITTEAGIVGVAIAAVCFALDTALNNRHDP